MKKFMKMIGLCIALVFCLSGCGKNNSTGAVFLYDAKDTFISEMTDALLSHLPGGISLDVFDAGNSQAAQNRQIVECLEDGTRLFIINAVDRLACSSIVEKCSGIDDVNIIFFNREPLADALSGKGNIYYVGAAADSLGEKQADMVAELFGDQFAGGEYDKNRDGIVQLVILKGEQGHQDAEKRTANCVSRMKALGFSIEVLAIEAADWNRDNAKVAMEKLYTKYGGSIELIFANNDDMALGAIDYLREQGVFAVSSDRYSQPIVVAGVDGTGVGLEAVRDGFLYGTVHNDFKKQANAVNILAEYLVQGDDISTFPYRITGEHYIYIDGDIITLENLDQYTDEMD